ncbi:hypothetical protein CJF32_00003350 [Rutstroemia sp. NJR-2017a WRK4]|nr:hypothetical protein CJF32_00003350 [Rutstroemia sp. NJR-2017a WRK4]
MLDENLPTFFFKASAESPLSTPIYLRQDGSDLQPEYSFRRPDPNLPASKNCYAVALCDSYNADVVYGEVLVQPEWTQPTLSQAEIRAQNGIPQPPVPIVPNGFTIQLYNPDQQVLVKQVSGSWTNSNHWEFEMPQTSFRVPSASALDRSQNDPAASDFTLKVSFKWKKDGKFSKDLSCFLVGKTVDGKKSKEPDIPIAMFKGGKDLTVYQPNMHRVDVEDFKGLEVVLLLSAAVIKDIFFNASREMFNISSPNTTPSGSNRKRNNSGPVIRESRSNSSPTMSGGMTPSLPARTQTNPNGPSPVNPRTQWEIDAETARLKALVEAEERERQRAEALEEQRIKQMLENEEKERRRREAEIAKETERLRKQYGVKPIASPPAHTQHHRVSFAAPQMPPRNSHPQPPQLITPYHSAPHSRPVPVQRPLSTPVVAPPGGAGAGSSHSWFGRRASGGTGAGAPSSPYLQAPGSGTASSSGFFGGSGKKMQKKRSVFF